MTNPDNLDLCDLEDRQENYKFLIPFRIAILGEMSSGRLQWYPLKSVAKLFDLAKPSKKNKKIRVGGGGSERF